MTPTLVFVYAVDGGVLGGAWDSLHKLVSPSTYPCALCSLAYGPIGPRDAWKRAIASLGVPTQFLHRDELRRRHPSVDVALPAVLVDRAGTLEVLIRRAEIDACRDLDALVALVVGRARTLWPDDG